MPGIKGGFYSIGATGSIGKGKKSLIAKAVEPPAPPPEPFEMGSEAIDRASTRSSFGILEAGPAPLSGRLTSVEIWKNSAGICTIGIWYLLEGNTYKCRSAVDLGVVASGSKQTLPVDLEVEAGDKIAIEQIGGGTIEAHTSGGVGVRWASSTGDKNVVDNELTIAVNLPADIWSLKGIGTT